MRIGIGLYGENGHQIHEALIDHSLARLVAVASFSREKLPALFRADQSIRHEKNLYDLLQNPSVDFVALCSPRREDQAADAIQALKAGKHVYAEKPCAFSESDLDAILRTSRETGRLFREMAGTAFEQPYLSMREIVKSGCLGQVVQVIAEKSYPYHERRPQDSGVDGGLIGNVMVHAFRFVEHVSLMKILSIRTIETALGNHGKTDGLRMGSACSVRLEQGAIGSLAANYLNPRGTGIWGYESLRILGTEGMVESAFGGKHTRQVIGDTDHGAIDTSAPNISYLNKYLQTILGRDIMPNTVEEEVSPTRWTIRSKEGLAADCVE